MFSTNESACVKYPQMSLMNYVHTTGDKVDVITTNWNNKTRAWNIIIIIIIIIIVVTKLYIIV